MLKEQYIIYQYKATTKNIFKYFDNKVSIVNVELIY